MGDPGGIGPEVVVKALADEEVRGLARWIVLGPEAVLREAASAGGIAPFWKREEGSGGAPERAGGVTLVDYPMAGAAGVEHESRAVQGALSFQLVEDAIAMALGKRGVHADAVVTGPISKEAWRLAGHGEFPGHTELFASRCHAERYGMMFVSPMLRVILVTAHVPLASVSGLLTRERIDETIRLGHEACIGLGIARPRIAVCCLNPHAGEAGLLGSEDAQVIVPAIGMAQRRRIDARGPFPGDTVFRDAVQGRFDLVVAMYHDQGLIPVKLLDRDRAVNVTVGLPIIRTSPDHGTAFGIAGQNRADPGSMKAALMLASRMAARSSDGATERGRDGQQVEH